MLDMVMNSVTLFFRGKLFADPSAAYTQLAIGVAVTVVLFLVSLLLFHLPHWAAAAVAGFIGGVLQPYLFRNLRYR